MSERTRPEFQRRSRRLLAELGLPVRDPHTWEASERRFADGSSVGLEVPGVQGPEALEELFEACDALGLPGPSRVVETRGLGALTQEEVARMVALCADRGIGLFASTGPRASRDVGRFATSAHGQRAAQRLRGMEGLVRGLDDALRAVELGVRGLLVYDEGLLEVLGRLRASGELPAGTRLKASIAMGTSNPVHAAQLERLGADSLNPVNDLPLAALAALREGLEIPLDVHVDDGAEAGRPDRLWEVPDLVAAAAPVFLKTGQGARLPTMAGCAQRLARVMEELERHCPEVTLLEEGAPEAAVPVR